MSIGAARTSHRTVVKRTPMPLTDRDQQELQTLRESGQTLGTSAPVSSAHASEAKLVHAVFEEGLRALNESAVEIVYQQMAEDHRRDAVAHRATVSSRRRGTAGLP